MSAGIRCGCEQGAPYSDSSAKIRTLCGYPQSVQSFYEMQEIAVEERSKQEKKLSEEYLKQEQILTTVLSNTTDTFFRTPECMNFFNEEVEKLIKKLYKIKIFYEKN